MNNAPLTGRASCQCISCTSDLKTRARLLAHVRSSVHTSFGVVNLTAEQLVGMGLATCPSCLRVFLSGDAHFQKCVPPKQPSLSSALSLVRSLLIGQQVGQLRESLLSVLAHVDTACLFDICPTFRDLPFETHLRRAIAAVFNLTASSLATDADSLAKAALLLPRWLLAAPPKPLPSKLILETIAQRIVLFLSGRVSELHCSYIDLSLTWANKPRVRSEQDTVNAVMHLYAKGECRKAVQALENCQPLADSNDPKVVKHLSELFPPAFNSDVPLSETTPSITLEALVSSLQASARGTGAGPSGLRMDHLRALLPFDAGQALLAMLNALIALPTTSPLYAALRSGACTLLVKPNGGLRPIVVTEVWLRLWAKSIVLTDQPRLSALLRPQQFGVNCPTGMQQIPLAVRLARSAFPSYCSVLLDIGNAYGCVDRHAVASAIESLECPSLQQYFAFLYGKPIKITTRGKASASSSRGLLQGDPLAPLLFCLAIRSILTLVQESMSSGLVMAFLDDITITGPASEVERAVSLLSSKLADIGLKVNSAKTKVLSHSASSPLPTLTSVSSSSDVVLLGSPIGSEKFESDHCLETARSACSLMTALRCLPSKQARLFLLRLCICPRLVHLARSTPPPALIQAAAVFDGAVLTGCAIL